MSSIYTFIFFFVWLAFAIPTLIVLMRLYQRTRLKSFLWLASSQFAFPLLMRGLEAFVPFFTNQTSRDDLLGIRGLSIYTLIFLVESVIDGALLLTAVVLLERELTASMEPVGSTASLPSA